jgi:hypothetical protein
MDAIRDRQNLLLLMMLGFYDAGSQGNGQNKVEKLNFGDARQNASAGAGPSHRHRRTTIGLAYFLLGGVPSPIP